MPRSAHINKCLGSFSISNLTKDDPIHRHTHTTPYTFLRRYTTSTVTIFNPRSNIADVRMLQPNLWSVLNH